MTTSNEYQAFIDEQSWIYGIAASEIKYIIEKGRELYYQSLADWAEFDMNIKPIDK